MEKSSSNSLKLTLQSLPKSSGVYRFYDKSGNLLYIGKAKVLKNRVSSYFQSSKAHNQRIAIMVSLIARIEYTEVKTEKEALILEANLINSLQPKYNISLKDDKSMVYVEYSKGDPIPGFFISRKNNINKDSIYYGPFTNTRELENILSTLRYAFPFCQTRFLQVKKCQYCSIGQCKGVCVGSEAISEYLKRCRIICNYFCGKSDNIIKTLNNNLNEAIAESNYEYSAILRDRINIIKVLIDKQKIVLSKPESLDMISVIYQIRDDGSAVFSFVVQQIRDGRIINLFNTILEGLCNTQEENFIIDTLTKFLFNYSVKNGYEIPIKVIVSQAIA